MSDVTVLYIFSLGWVCWRGVYLLFLQMSQVSLSRKGVVRTFVVPVVPEIVKTYELLAPEMCEVFDLLSAGDAPALGYTW